MDSNKILTFSVDVEFKKEEFITRLDDIIDLVSELSEMSMYAEKAEKIEEDIYNIISKLIHVEVN